MKFLIARASYNRDVLPKWLYDRDFGDWPSNLAAEEITALTDSMLDDREQFVNNPPLPGCELQPCLSPSFYRFKTVDELLARQNEDGSVNHREVIRRGKACTACDYPVYAWFLEVESLEHALRLITEAQCSAWLIPAEEICTEYPALRLQDEPIYG